MKKLILLIFIAHFGLAQNFKTVKDTVALRLKVEQMSKTVKSIESDFTQEKNLSLLSEKILSKGHDAAVTAAQVLAGRHFKGKTDPQSIALYKLIDAINKPSTAPIETQLAA